MFLVSHLKSRNDLPSLFPDATTESIMVEVGTHRGEYAEKLFQTWPGILYCVDPWNNPPWYEEQAKYLWGNGDRAEDMSICEENLAEYITQGRCHLLPMLSEDALKKFVHPQPDVVYLDGDHSIRHVRFDVHHWWKRLKPGGILAGHDIVMPGKDLSDPENWGRNIQNVIYSFAVYQQVPVYLIVEADDLPWSYYMVKPHE